MEPTTRQLARVQRVNAKPTPETDVRSAALRRDLARRFELFCHDELRVMDQIALRLELGREGYGKLDLSKARDWQRDEAEELLDMRVYQACALIQQQDDERQALRNAAAVEQLQRVENCLAEFRDAEVYTAPAHHFELGGEGG